MKLNYVKISPAQNMTVLITDFVNQEDHMMISNAVMRYDSLNAEQVGFIVTPSRIDSKIGLRMAGGEFCGNALLSAAAYGTYKGLCPVGDFCVDSSGVNNSLRCETKPVTQNCFSVCAEMPEPVNVRAISLDVLGEAVTGSVVELYGISHFVAEFWPDSKMLDSILDILITKTPSSAIGVIPYRRLSLGSYEIHPYVYVRGTESRVFERACGSGSYALGVHLFRERGEMTAEVHQPGGVISVGMGTSNWISTDVTISSEGSVYIGGNEELA